MQGPVEEFGVDDRHRLQPTGNHCALLVTTWNDGGAVVIRQRLSAYKIPSQVVSDVPHAVLPIFVDGLGEVRILVPTSRLRDPRRLLAEHRRQGLRVVRGGRARDLRRREAAPARNGE